MANEKRLVNAEAIARKLKYAHCTDCNVVRQIQCSACWVSDVLDLLDGDSVDAVEVVRCKFCVSVIGNDTKGYVCANQRCPCWAREVPADFSCVCGERKDND